MKPSGVVTLLAVIASASSVIAQPNQVSANPEIAAALIEASKVVTLAGDATLRVSADRAVVKVSVATEAKALAESSEKNQKIRESLKQSLMKQGIPEDRIRSSRFSSTPRFGSFSGKAKSYRVENQMRITVESEAEFQTVAAQIDSRSEMTYQGLEAIDSKEADNKGAVLLQACEVVNRKKAAVEQSFKVRLAPARLAEGSAGVPRQLGVQGGLSPDINTITGILTDPAFRVPIHALEQRADDGYGFGEKTYRVLIAAEFQIVK